ncbi:MAG: hypothetical protein ACRYFA_12255 [Janthinobacterium lividum]
MKKHFFLLLTSLIFIVNVKAQSSQTTLGGVVFKEQNFSDVKGSPYVFGDWTISTVQTSNGIYNNINIKYSELDDQVYFKNKEQEMMQFADPVKDFIFSYKQNDKQVLAHYRNGYTNIAGSSSSAFFEVLVEGKVQLLKKTTKKVREEVVYGSTVSNKSFLTTTRYYIITPEKGILVKKDKKSVLTALSIKQNELEDYTKKNNIDFKKDDDIIKVIAYFNSIQPTI